MAAFQPKISEARHRTPTPSRVGSKRARRRIQIKTCEEKGRSEKKKERKKRERVTEATLKGEREKKEEGVITPA